MICQKLRKDVSFSPTLTSDAEALRFSGGTSLVLQSGFRAEAVCGPLLQGPQVKGTALHCDVLDGSLLETHRAHISSAEPAGQEA